MKARDLAVPGARRDRAPEWFDAQYNNRARIPEHLDILREWAERSHARARQPRRARSTSPTADAPSERLDVFPPRAPGAPVLVYIHGGYWRALDKRDQCLRRPAASSTPARWSCCRTTRCARRCASSTSSLQLVQALAWVWRHAAEHGGDPSRIVVAGHSAGGHLAAMMLACDWPRGRAPTCPRIWCRAALAVSGLRARAAAPRAVPRRRPAARRRVGAPPQPARHAGARAAASSPSSAATRARSSCARTRLIAAAWGPRAVPVVRGACPGAIT